MVGVSSTWRNISLVNSLNFRKPLMTDSVRVNRSIYDVRRMPFNLTYKYMCPVEVGDSLTIEASIDGYHSVFRSVDQC